MTTGRDFLLDTEDEGDEASPDSDSESESEGDKDPKSSDKRVRDLQSKADKETARANKAEAELKRLRTAIESDPESGDPAPAGTPVDGAILDMARMFAYQQNPKLAEYDIPASSLNGSTPSEIAASAAELVARFEKIETKARNKLLAENGQAPEIDAGAPPPQPRDFSSMSKEDFKKLVDETMGKSR